MKTFLQLKTEVRAVVWPSGEPENLIAAHDAMFEEGLADLQKWIECERDNNVNVIPFCATLFKCGLTVTDAPDGIIRRIYTIANEEWCDIVSYRQKDWPEPEKWARNWAVFDKPLNVGFPRLPQGLQFAEATTDTDSVVGRAREGVFSIWNKRLYLAPWIQSNESVVIEWKGLKKHWLDTDLVNEDLAFRLAVKYYLQFAHERDFGDNAEAKKFKDLYDEQLAELMWECRERTRARSDLDYDDERSRFTSELKDDAKAVPTEMTFAHIGNYAINTSVESNVAALVASFQPSFILASGQNLADLGALYDRDIGQYYHDRIYPYGGAYGNGAAVNQFWPAVGPADWDAADNDLAQWYVFFKLPNNERYYDFVRGDVHFFIIDSDARDPDGNTQGGVQGTWVQAKLALSTAVWKVVVMSDYVNWPWETWGADLVISADSSQYERIQMGGIFRLTNGMGGKTPETLAPEAGSVIQHTAEFGALKLVASSAKLHVQFWDRYSYLIDEFTLTV